MSWLGFTDCICICFQTTMIPFSQAFVICPLPIQRKFTGSDVRISRKKIYLRKLIVSDDILNSNFLTSVIFSFFQGETFSDFESMTDRLIDEILLHISNYSTPPTRISFVGHSLGTILIRSAISKPKLAHLVPFFHTYLSLSGPHLGTLYNNSGLGKAI